MKSATKGTFNLVLGLVLGILVGTLGLQLFSSSPTVDAYEKLESVLKTVEENYVDDVATDEVIESAIAGMLDRLDPHSVYIPAEQFARVEEDFRGSFEGIGIEFDVIRDTITVVAAISGGPSERLGIISGDKIVVIDGEDAVGISRDEVPKRLKGERGTTVNVGIRRPGTDRTLDFSIIRDEIPLTTVDAAFVTDNGTAYIKVNRFADPTYEEFVAKMAELQSDGMKRLVLDLRGNPGGYMDRAVRMADELIGGKQRLVFTKSPRSANEVVYRSQDGQAYESLPLIVLVSPGSASASEILAGAVQDLDRGLIVGETTFGKGLVQRQFRLPDSSAFRLTIARYYTPSGRLIQRPYSDDDRSAYYSLENRQRRAEGENVTHEGDDSTGASETYFTVSGRKVIGGGGITPDYIVRPDTLSAESGAWEIITNNVIWEYVEGYMASEGEQLRASYGDGVDRFVRDYAVSSAMFARFLDLAETKGVRLNREKIAQDRSLLKGRIKARIARAIWGDNAFYRVALQTDRQFRTAMTLFDEAIRIASR